MARQDAIRFLQNRAGPILGLVLLHVAFFLLFIALSRLSSVFQSTELRTSPWHPATGVAFAAGLVLGRPAIVTMALAILVSTRLWGWPLPGFWELVSAGLRALVFTGMSAAIARHLSSGEASFLQIVLRFLAYAVVVTIVYAFVRVLVLWWSVGIEPAYLLDYTITLSIGNLVGIVTLVPFFMPSASPRVLMRSDEEWGAYQWAALAGVVVTSFMVFGRPETDEFKFFYLVFLPVIAFSVRNGLPAAALSIFLSDVLMLGILYWRSFESSTATELQFLMLTLSATGLLLGAAISDRKRAVQQLADSHMRLQESQSALLQASRLSLASEMATALAHELNQPLSSIRNYVRAVRRRLDSRRIDRVSIQTDIDAAVNQVDEAATLLRTTRRFLERGGTGRDDHDLHRIIRDTTALVEPELMRSGIELTLKPSRSAPLIHCSDVQIQQVILNVVKNAKDAMVAHGSAVREIIIEVSTTTRPGFAEVVVRDSGPGVPPALRPLLFKPLQSTKPQGLGLGLSLCSSIVRNHGGEFWLDEAAVGGAVFAFTLPVVESKVRDEETDHDRR